MNYSVMLKIQLWCFTDANVMFEKETLAFLFADILKLQLLDFVGSNILNIGNEEGWDFYSGKSAISNERTK